MSENSGALGIRFLTVNSIRLAGPMALPSGTSDDKSLTTGLQPKLLPERLTAFLTMATFIWSPR